MANPTNLPRRNRGQQPISQARHVRYPEGDEHRVNNVPVGRLQQGDQLIHPVTGEKTGVVEHISRVAPDMWLLKHSGESHPRTLALGARYSRLVPTDHPISMGS